MESTGFRKTHPLVLGAAASVMVVSLVGAAAIGGLLPNARSDKTDTPAQRSAPAADSARHGVSRLAARDSACASCGTVESIRALELKGDATGLGAVAGGVTGAVAGNEIEKNVKKHYSYRVTVHMDDGSFRTVSESTAPTVAVGERVQIANGALVAHS